MTSDEQAFSNRLPMGVPVVDVRIMRMRVDQFLVAMPMGMWFARDVPRNNQRPGTSGMNTTETASADACQVTHTDR